MIDEIIYTSAVKGLKPGSRGFCTVVSTSGMAQNLAERLESLSGYRHAFPIHSPQAALNPVNYSHLTMRVGGNNLHVLSRVADAGQDYSGRSNKLAHHLAFADTSHLPSGPARLLEHPQSVVTAWDGETKLIAPRNLSAPAAPNSIRLTAWEAATGDNAWAGYVAEQLLADNHPLSIIFDAGTDTLALVREVFDLIPPMRRWGITFSTYFTRLLAGTQCQLRFVLNDTSDATALRNNAGARVLDVTRPLPQAAGGPLVDQARSGVIDMRSAARPVAKRERPAARMSEAPAAIHFNSTSDEAPPLAAAAMSATTGGPPPINQPIEAPSLFDARRKESRESARPRWILPVAVATFLLITGVGGFAVVQLAQSDSAATSVAVTSPRDATEAKGKAQDATQITQGNTNLTPTVSLSVETVGNADAISPELVEKEAVEPTVELADGSHAHPTDETPDRSDLPFTDAEDAPTAARDRDIFGREITADLQPKELDSWEMKKDASTTVGLQLGKDDTLTMVRIIDNCFSDGPNAISLFKCTEEGEGQWQICTQNHYGKIKLADLLLENINGSKRLRVTIIANKGEKAFLRLLSFVPIYLKSNLSSGYLRLMPVHSEERLTLKQVADRGKMAITLGDSSELFTPNNSKWLDYMVCEFILRNEGGDQVASQVARRSPQAAKLVYRYALPPDSSLEIEDTLSTRFALSGEGLEVEVDISTNAPVFNRDEIVSLTRSFDESKPLVFSSEPPKTILENLRQRRKTCFQRYIEGHGSQVLKDHFETEKSEAISALQEEMDSIARKQQQVSADLKNLSGDSQHEEKAKLEGEQHDLTQLKMEIDSFMAEMKNDTTSAVISAIVTQREDYRRWSLECRWFFEVQDNGKTIRVPFINAESAGGQR